MSRYDELAKLLEELESDIEKFYNKGNKAAGTRARRTLQELKRAAQEIRLEIQDWKNTGKVDEIDSSEAGDGGFHGPKNKQG